MSSTVFVTHRQWDSAVNSIVRTNIRNHGKSLTGASMRGGDIIVEIQSDRDGMIVKANWRNLLKSKYLVPTETPQDALQAALLDAVKRCKKSGRHTDVVRFRDEYGHSRYRSYSGTLSKAFDDCRVGEQVIHLGSVDGRRDDNHPIPFYCSESFKDEYAELPLVRDWETKLFGMPYREWASQLTAESR